MSLATAVINLFPEHIKKKIIKFIFTGERKIAFYQRLKDGVNNNQTISQVLEIMARFYGKHEAIEEIIVQKALEQRKRGASEMDILREWISSEEQIIIRSGEQVGFGMAFDRCIKLEQKHAEIRDIFKSEMSGPIVRLLLIIGIFVFIGKGILPELMAAAKHDVTAGNIFTYILYLIMLFVNSPWGLISLGGLVGFIILLIWSMPNWTGKLRTFFDKIPPWSGYRIMVGANWLSSISLMISSNMTIKTALEETCSIAAKDNPWLYERIAAILSMYGPNTFGMSFVKSGYAFPDQDIVDEMEMYSEQNVDESRYLKLADDWSSRGAGKMRLQIQILSKVSQGLFYAVTIIFVLGIYLFTQDATSAMGV